MFLSAQSIDTIISALAFRIAESSSTHHLELIVYMLKNQDIGAVSDLGKKRHDRMLKDYETELTFSLAEDNLGKE